MSTEPADRQPEAGPPARGRSGAFALPVSTSLRFALLIAAVVASSFFVYQCIYLATPGGPALISLVLRCRSQALAHRPSGMTATASMASALHQASVRPDCSSRGPACPSARCSSGPSPVVRWYT